MTKRVAVFNLVRVQRVRNNAASFQPLERHMPTATLAFQFRQRFPFPAPDVYRWATDYQPADLGLLGRTGRRGIQVINEDTVLLTDVTVSADGKRTAKKKIVRLFPDRLRWTNTHVSGPNLYSQFIYELVPMGKKACRLEFTGRQLVTVAKVNRAQVARMAREVCEEDATMWKGLAKALARDLRRQNVRS